MSTPLAARSKATLSVKRIRFQRMSIGGNVPPLVSPEPRSSHTAEMVGYRMFVSAALGPPRPGRSAHLRHAHQQRGADLGPRCLPGHVATMRLRLWVSGWSSGGSNGGVNDCVVLDTASRSTKSPLPSTLGRARVDGDTAAVVAHASDAQPGVCTLPAAIMLHVAIMQHAMRLAVHLARISLAPLPPTAVLDSTCRGLATPRSKLQVSSAGHFWWRCNEPARLTLTGPSNTTAGRGSSSASSAGSVARPPSDRAPLLLAARNQTGAVSNEDQIAAKRNSMGIGRGSRMPRLRSEKLWVWR